MCNRNDNNEPTLSKTSIFYSHVRRTMPLTPEALLSVFKSIDLDDSGTIELRELEAFCAPCLLGDGARQSSAQQSRITELFAQVDTDGSGVISFDEFCEARGHPLYCFPSAPVSSHVSPRHVDCLNT